MLIRHEHNLNISFKDALHLRVSVLEPHQPPPPSGVVTIITAKLDGGFMFTAEGPHMAYTLPDGLQVNLKVQYQDAGGNSAKIDGNPVWSSSNPEVASITPTPGNPLIANLLAHSIGTAQVIVKADADLDDDEQRTLISTLDVEVVAGEAVAGVISPAGEPAPPSPGGPGRR